MREPPAIQEGCRLSCPLRTMFRQTLSTRTIAASLLWAAIAVEAGTLSHVSPRQLPANATGVQTITTPSNVTIRFKNPGDEGVCETTPGVNSYSGYIDLAPDVHTFFWFFEARTSPKTAPLTLWRECSGTVARATGQSRWLTCAAQSMEALEVTR